MDQDFSEIEIFDAAKSIARKRGLLKEGVQISINNSRQTPVSYVLVDESSKQIARIDLTAIEMVAIRRRDRRDLTMRLGEAAPNPAGTIGCLLASYIIFPPLGIVLLALTLAKLSIAIFHKPVGSRSARRSHGSTSSEEATELPLTKSQQKEPESLHIQEKKEGDYVIRHHESGDTTDLNSIEVDEPWETCEVNSTSVDLAQADEDTKLKFQILNSSVQHTSELHSQSTTEANYTPVYGFGTWVSGFYRRGTYVSGYFNRKGRWVSGFLRRGSFVRSHWRRRRRW